MIVKIKSSISAGEEMGIWRSMRHIMERSADHRRERRP